MNNKNSESCLMRNKLLNKLNNKNYNNSNCNLIKSGIIDNNQNNNIINKNNNKIFHIKNKYSVNLKSSNNLKYLNNVMQPTLKSKIIGPTIKVNCKSNSISSLKEIKLNYNKNREMLNDNNIINNNYNNMFNNNNSLIQEKYNTNYIFTQRNNLNNKI